MQAFQTRVRNILSSDKMRKAEQDAQPFFKEIHDYAFGRATSMENMVYYLLSHWLVALY